MKEKNYCEKWPTGCQLCDVLPCDGEEETAFKRQRAANNIILFRMIGANPIKCDPCKPTQPECGECEFAKPITNADRIRRMTDEELAEFLSIQMVAEVVHGWKSWLDWLKQEATDG